jgi:hypothetical protein
VVASDSNRFPAAAESLISPSAIAPAVRVLLAAMVLTLPLAGCESSSGISSDAAASNATGATATAVGTISRTGPGSSASPAVTPGSSATTAPAGTTGTAGTGTTPGANSSTPAAPAVTPPSPAAATPELRKSISAWVSCSGISDDNAGVAKAFAAARHNAFTLVVDCPVNVKIGTDIGRSIFIDDGTAVEFAGAGKFTVDNVFIPAFVIADSNNITLTNWNVEYDGSLPVSEAAAYEINGQSAVGKPGNAFNDTRLTQWLAANRAIVFDNSQGAVHAQWTGTTPACAVFYIAGDSSNVNVAGMQMYVPKAAGGDRFIPAAFTLGVNFKRNQTVTAKTPLTSQYAAIPHDLTFSNVILDGTYMGWVGEVKNSVFENIQSKRYADLQDSNGKNIGGVGKWFAPPHLFYFGYSTTGDPGLFNSNIEIKNVVDAGVRVGNARDLGAGDTISGYANSLKIGCVSCRVDSYDSSRPDGLMDILSSDGLTISNVTGIYNSAFTNNLYPGWRFPSASYKNVRFENVTLTDTAVSTVQSPIGNAGVLSNQGLTLSNVHVLVNKWEQETSPFPVIAGEENNVSLNYAALVNQATYLKSQTNTVEIELQAVPAQIHVGETTSLKWLSRQANSCSGAGAWGVNVAPSGSTQVKMTSAGTYNYTLACRNANSSTTTTVSVVVSL